MTAPIIKAIVFITAAKNVVQTTPKLPTNSHHAGSSENTAEK